MAVTSIIILGMSAALVFSARAADLGTDANGQAANVTQVIDQIRAELAVATQITTRTKTNIAFTIPDRDADAVPERIEYTWSGKPGDALLREFNSRGPSPIVERCFGVDFTCLVKPAPSITTGATQTLLSITGADSEEFGIKDPFHAAAQLFRPATVPGRSVMTISSVRVRLQRTTNNAFSMRMRLFSAQESSPMKGTLLATASLNSTVVPTAYDWVTFTPPVASTVSTSAGVWVVLDSPNATSEVARVSYSPLATGQTSEGMLATSLDGGATWSFEYTSDMLIQIQGAWGTATYPPEALQ